MLVLHSFWICRAEDAFVSAGSRSSMRRKVLLMVNATVITMVAAACGPRPSADRTDTSTTSAKTLAVTRRDTAAAAPLDTFVSSTPTVPTADAASSVIQPISCTPTTFGSGDTLTLRMGTPHGNQLSIHSPDRTTYSVVYPTLGKPRRNYSLISSEEFRKIGTFPVPADVRAIPQVYGRDTILEPVFTKTGKYLIVMGENLASDYSNRSTYCTVAFLSRSR